MTKRILKFHLDITDEQQVVMHAGAQILTAQFQHNELQLWAICDDAVLPAYGRVPRRIVIYGTGQPLPENPGRHISTVQQKNGKLIWHIFERSTT